VGGGGADKTTLNSLDWRPEVESEEKFMGTMAKCAKNIKQASFGEL
jgi:hypothetical protein